MTGRQVVVTYEHDGAWTGPVQNFVGDSLPNTMRKLRAHAPLRVVAYGDSITHGVGVSRLMHISPLHAAISGTVRQTAETNLSR